MGLVVANSVGLSGLVAPKPDVQTFTSAGSTTWTKPAGCTRVYIEVIGAGGGGGSGQKGSASREEGGAGGGGGAMTRGVYDANALPSTLTIAVGAGGNGGAAVTSAAV